MSYIFKRSLAALTGLLCLSAAQAQQNKEQQVNLEPLAVVSTRIDTATELTPANITVINAEQIQQSPAQTLPELLSLEAGVLSRSLYGNGGARSTVDIRGFGASGSQNTLILLDGRRLNDIDLSSPNYAAIPMQNIERIEITRGAGGVMYGDGAVGGAVNIVTKRPAPGETEGSASISYGSYNTRETDMVASVGGEKYAINLAANYVNSEGYRDNNELRQKNAQVDVSRFFGSTELFVKGGFSDQHLGLPGPRSVNPVAGVNELVTDRRGTGTPNDYAKEENQYITVGSKSSIFGGAGQAVVDFGYRQKRQEAFFESFSAFTSDEYLETDLDTWSFTPRMDAKLGSHQVVAGLDFYKYEYDSDRAAGQDAINQPIHRINASQETYALYVNDRISFTSDTYIEVGARIQRVNFEATDRFNPSAPGAGFGNQAAPLDRSDTEPMFNIGVRHFLTDYVSVFSNIGRSTRFATIDERFQVVQQGPFTFTQVFSDIEPQTAEHIDIGMDYSSRVLDLSVTAFYMDLENEIFFDALNFINRNLDPTTRSGVEFSSDWQITKNISAYLNYTYLRAKFSEGAFDGNDVPYVPRHTANIGMNWQPIQNMTLTGNWRYVGEKFYENDPANNFSQKIPSYDFLDLKAAYSLGDWRVSLAANNVLDEQAYSNAINSTSTPGSFNAYPLPERSYTLSLGYKF